MTAQAIVKDDHSKRSPDTDISDGTLAIEGGRSLLSVRREEIVYRRYNDFMAYHKFDNPPPPPVKEVKRSSERYATTGLNPIWRRCLGRST